MTTKIASTPEVGEQFHFLRTGTMFHTRVHGIPISRIANRGDQVTVTEELLELNRDRLGQLAPWLALAHDRQAQINKFGYEAVAPGPWPDLLAKTLPGTPEHDEAREEARRIAWTIEDEGRRREALDAVETEFGPASVTSKVLATFGQS